MKLKQTINLIDIEGSSSKIQPLLSQIRDGISKMENPVGSGEFLLYGEKKCNGVKPIKDTFMQYLRQNEWLLEYRLDVGVTNSKPGPIDAVYPVGDKFFAVEWETGNISSSHRAINKIVTGILNGKLIGGVLILPSREMYEYLTDRVGNFRELSPYFNVWSKARYDVAEGYVGVIEIEHDGTTNDEKVKLTKGTDGRALV
ncbi:hypothetical protein POF51_29910 [Brevibacillus sp. AG]|uniref:hypothetical protein n=1 Tax=Brevibacillus sp. AG TaxID=3020891 RepID=UPI00232AC227|nr:hypothetical protein [Brevibacillus sp. AG]MDC0764941.1 hypothetical protein [Brevibacillus sp. AG]